MEEPELPTILHSEHQGLSGVAQHNHFLIGVGLHGGVTAVASELQIRHCGHEMPFS